MGKMNLTIQIDERSRLSSTLTEEDIDPTTTHLPQSKHPSAVTPGVPVEHDLFLPRKVLVSPLASESLGKPIGSCDNSNSDMWNLHSPSSSHNSNDSIYSSPVTDAGLSHTPSLPSRVKSDRFPSSLSTKKPSALRIVTEFEDNEEPFSGMTTPGCGRGGAPDGFPATPFSEWPDTTRTISFPDFPPSPHSDCHPISDGGTHTRAQSSSTTSTSTCSGEDDGEGYGNKTQWDTSPPSPHSLIFRRSPSNRSNSTPMCSENPALGASKTGGMMHNGCSPRMGLTRTLVDSYSSKKAHTRAITAKNNAGVSDKKNICHESGYVYTAKSDSSSATDSRAENTGCRHGAREKPGGGSPASPLSGGRSGEKKNGEKKNRKKINTSSTMETIKQKPNINMHDRTNIYSNVNTSDNGTTNNNNNTGTTNIITPPIINTKTHQNKAMMCNEQTTGMLMSTPKKSSITLMVRNFPRRSSQSRLIERLHASGFEGTYDFVYLPFCFAKKQNLGYAFINFRTPKDANTFTERWHNKSLDNLPNPRALHVCIAHIQGKEQNVKHLLRECKSSKIVNPRFQPVVYEHGVRVDFVEYVNRLNLAPFGATLEEGNYASNDHHWV